MSPETAPAQDADALLDEYLGDSKEQPPVTPSKPAKSGRSENETVEEEPDDEGDELPPEDEDEEAEDTDEQDDAGPDEDEDESEDEAGRFVGQNGRVKLADGTVTTVAELIKGNLREADYTRKLQSTGALGNELQARLADYAQQEKLVATAIEIMAAALPPEPDPSLLQPGETYDPVGYMSQERLWTRAAQQLQGLMQARDEMTSRNEEMHGTLLKRYAMEQKEKLLSYRPQLKDKAALDAYQTDIVRTLGRYGKGPDDLAQVYDADIIRMLEDLGKYHKILAGRRAAKRKVQGAPAVMAPSVRQSPQGRKARAKGADWDTLRKTGSHGAAGEAALDRILDDLVR